MLGRFRNFTKEFEEIKRSNVMLSSCFPYEDDQMRIEKIGFSCRFCGKHYSPNETPGKLVVEGKSRLRVMSVIECRCHGSSITRQTTVAAFIRGGDVIDIHVNGESMKYLKTKHLTLKYFLPLAAAVLLAYILETNFHDQLTRILWG